MFLGEAQQCLDAGFADRALLHVRQQRTGIDLDLPGPAGSRGRRRSRAAIGRSMNVVLDRDEAALVADPQHDVVGAGRVLRCRSARCRSGCRRLDGRGSCRPGEGVAPVVGSVAAGRRSRHHTRTSPSSDDRCDGDEGEGGASLHTSSDVVARRVVPGAAADVALRRAAGPRRRAALRLGRPGVHPHVARRRARRRAVGRAVARHPSERPGDARRRPPARATLTGELPYLLKVLAAAEPLSLQAHPDAEQARDGFERGDLPRPQPQAGAAVRAHRRSTRSAASVPSRPRSRCSHELGLASVLGLADVLASDGPRGVLDGAVPRHDRRAQPVVDACATSRRDEAAWVATSRRALPRRPERRRHVAAEPRPPGARRGAPPRIRQPARLPARGRRSS